MLLSTVLLLFLLGTSVAALRSEPVDPHLIQTTLGHHVDLEANRPDPNPPRPQALELHNDIIHTIVDFWYRLPSKDAHIKQCNDVIEVVRQGNFGLKIRPTTPEIVLTLENLERFRGLWRRVIKASNTRDDRLQFLEVQIVVGMAPRLFVHRDLLLSASPLRDAGTATDPLIFQGEYVDFWYRKPTVGMDEKWMRDVMHIHADQSKTFYKLSGGPGEMRRNNAIKDADKRAFGTWRRMPRAKVKTILRRDELTIAARSNGGFHYEFVEEQVHMIGWDPDHPL
ncbi:hypothetical protein F5887DRAFT_1001977 [Amanita rubescens]|nr:hypothetical protein F5887DRAFT_1001977 [Amanita rubescens]